MSEDEILNVGIVIPTFNGGDLWYQVAEGVSKLISNKKIKKVLIIDSGSTDGTVDIALKHNFSIHKITSSEFNHGGTRNLGVKLVDSEIVIFLTQDAIPTKDCFDNLLASFQDPLVAAAYGRQLPHVNANPIAQHARKFNYGKKSYIADKSSKENMGLKTVFISNSFSAYKSAIFNELGGFANNTILGEDMYFAATAVTAGYKIAYCASASVYHSHNYSFLEEFKRYFDIGVFHHDEKWIRESFGGAGGEGKRFIISEIKFLMRNNLVWIPIACIYNALKIIGYKMGQNYDKLSIETIKKLSMHRRYWN